MAPIFSQTKVNIKLPFSFIIFALIAFVISQIILFVHADFIADGYFRTPGLWMAFHLLILGWAIMVVMGAMYQLVPVAFLTPIWSETFGFIQFFVTSIGIISLVVLLGFAPSYAVYGGALAILGILMFMFQMFMTIHKQKDKNMITWLVIFALISFLLTILLGFLLAWNLANGELIDHNNIFQSHLLFGVVGWFTLLIFGFSYKLVPMFSLSHGFSMKGAKKALIAYGIGLLILFASIWVNTKFLQPIGWLVLLIGFTLFFFDIREILAKRSKKKLDRPFSFSIIAIYFGYALHLFAFLVSILDASNMKLWAILTYLYLMTWVIFSILGYLYKIVPVLWWTLKYSERVGKEKVPLLKDFINEKASVVYYSLFVIGTLGFTLSAYFGILPSIQVFQGLLVIAAMLYSISIFRVLTK
jgi:hypothetical protein